MSSCADRKRTGLGSTLRIGTFSHRDPHERFQAWWRALASTKPNVIAEELYVGPYWATIRSLANTKAKGHYAITPWVASAGYGLVASHTPVHPYSATFRANVADSVVRPADVMKGFDSRDWWTALGRNRVSGPRQPRTLTALAKSVPRSRIMFIGSASYLDALESDLLGALEVLGSPDRLILVSGAPGPRHSDLQRCWVAAEARHLAKVGGSLPALHARVARQILNDVPRYGLETRALSLRWRAIAERSPEMAKTERLISTDQEVKDFIRAALQKDPGLKHTRLLRDYRASGRACEQSRFRDLYRELTSKAER